MAQRTASEAFTGAFNEGLDKFVQMLLQSYQTEFQIRQQQEAQQLEQQRYEQERIDRLEAEQRAEQRDQARFVSDLLRSQQEMLMQQQAQVDDPAMRSRLAGEIDSLAQVMVAGAAGPDALLQSYQQYQQGKQQQPSGQTTLKPRQPEWVPTGAVNVVPEQIQANVKPPASPMALTGMGAGVAREEEARRTEIKEARERAETERQNQKRFYEQLYFANYQALQSGDMSPEYRQALAAQFEGVDPELLPPGALKVLEKVGVATDPRAQEIANLKLDTARLGRDELEQRIENTDWQSDMERLQFYADTGFGYERMSQEERAQMRTLLTDAGETYNGEPITDDGRLRAWMGQRFGERRRVQQAEVRSHELGVEATEVQIRQGNQNITRTANLMEHETWQHSRNKVTAGYEDEEFGWRREQFGWTQADRQVEQQQFYIDNIANAVKHGNPEVLELYREHYADPKSETGRRLRRTLGEDGAALLDRKLEQAQEMQDLQVESVRTDTATRQVAYQEAVISLETSEVLAPYQREAMALTYQRDGAQARTDIESMALNTAVDKATALGQMAQVVPPEAWDNLSPEVRGAMRELGLEPADYRSMSETYSELRDQPLRTEALRKYEFLAASDPRSDADKAAAVVTARTHLTDAGITDPEVQNGMLAVLQAGWSDNADARWRAHQQLTLTKAAQAARTGPEGVSLDDLTSLDNSLNRLIDNENVRMERLRDGLQINGCAQFVETQGMIFYSPTNNPSDECGQMMEQYVSSYEDFSALVQRSSEVSETMARKVGVAKPKAEEAAPTSRIEGAGDAPFVELDLTPEAMGMVQEAADIFNSVENFDDLEPAEQQRLVEIGQSLRAEGLTDEQLDRLIGGGQ